MKIAENKRLFREAIQAIERCSDAIIKNDKGVVIEYGSILWGDVFFSHVLDRGTIALYVDNKQVLEFSNDDLVLLAFKELLEELRYES